LGLTYNTQERNRAKSERASIEKGNVLLLAMGDVALQIRIVICMYVTDNEALMYKIMREVYVQFIHSDKQ
jgi:hypothetical protein